MMNRSIDAIYFRLHTDAAAPPKHSSYNTRDSGSRSCAVVTSVCSLSAFAQSVPQLSPALSNAVHDLTNKIAAAAGNVRRLSRSK